MSKNDTTDAPMPWPYPKWDDMLTREAMVDAWSQVTGVGRQRRFDAAQRLIRSLKRRGSIAGRKVERGEMTDVEYLAARKAAQAAAIAEVTS